MMPRLLPILLQLLLFAADPISGFSLNSSSSSVSDRPSVHTKPHHKLFSTHSLNPWSRSSWLYRLQHQAAHFENEYRSTDNVHVEEANRGYDDEYEGGFPHLWRFSENVNLADSLKYLLHKFEGEGKQALRIVSRVVWIILLLYLLGTTASDYFSCTLEKLAEALRLSPAVAGVTLLAIGNGAPDVFSSVAAFVSSDRTASIGFGAILGGALFVTTVVSGTVALVTAREGQKSGYQRIKLVCFVRDVLFLMASVVVLAVIILDGKVHLWEAISFLCVYVLYAASVWAAEILENRQKQAPSVLDPFIPKGLGESSLSYWSNSQGQVHHFHRHSQDVEVELECYLESTSYSNAVAKCKDYVILIYKYGIEWPLAIPRRLTIPVVEEERWSRPLAIITCILGPLFVGGLYIAESNSSSMPVTLVVSGAVGILLGSLAYFNTENSRPPIRCLWAWLAGGFFMSIVWFYVVADQLVSSLETLGSIFQIDSAILGLTVLAWGNSIGDLVADVALACSGRDGVQIAVSGCYAGPLFNTVVGLGLSLVVACSKAYPEPLLIVDDDGSLYFIIGFLGAGLAWALVMMPLKGMRLSRSFGAGLVLVYCSFLVTGVCYAIGWILR